MKLNVIQKVAGAYNAVVLPFSQDMLSAYSGKWCEQVACLKNSGAFTAENEQVAHFTALENGCLVNVFLLGLGKTISASQALYSFSKVFGMCGEAHAEKVLVDVESYAQLKDKAIFEKICEAALYSTYDYDKYKSEKHRFAAEQVDFLCNGQNLDAAVQEAQVCISATLMARDLINESPSIMTPQGLAQAACNEFKELPVKVTAYDREQTEKIGLTAFLQVGKGSIYEPRLIVMEYNGAPDSNEKLGFVGKGLTYDSGGYSLKDANGMETMGHDMSGGAAVIGAIRAIAEQKLPINVTGVIAACENKLSATSYVPGDVIPSLAGKYIEINNTDAEGRVTLADAVTYIKKFHHVNRIIDIATLTGGIVVALGNRRAGLFTNDSALADVVKQASEDACEPVWELPCDQNLRDVLISKVAHMRNSAQGSSAGGHATVGAMFVREFVEDTPWVHLDIAGTAWNDTQEYFYTRGGIGFGTKLLYQAAKHLCTK